MSPLSRPALRALALAAPLSALVAGGCSAPGKGALVLAISTDMQVPKDIDVISVYITTDGVPKFNYMGRVQPDGSVSLPSTLAVVEPDSPGAQVRFRVIGFQTQPAGSASARVLRDILTTVPHQRTALLRIPLDFLDLGSGQGTLPATYVPGDAPEGATTFDVESITSSCDWVTQQQTSINGVCTSAGVDSSTLPGYADAEVYGDGGLALSGMPVSCFDVAGCFANAMPVAELDPNSCTFPLPAGADPSTLNIALVAPGTGTCLASGCYVPLASDPTDGWTVQNQVVQLLPGVCLKLSSTVTLVTAQGCLAEPLSEPVCQPGEIGASSDAGGLPDSSEMDSSEPDSTVLDSGARDASLADTGLADASPEDAPTSSEAGTSPAALIITPESVSFGTVPIDMPASQMLTVLNTGGTASGPLEISYSGAGAADFATSADDCSDMSLMPQNTCAFSVTFTATAAGSVSAQVVVMAAGGPMTSAVLSGTGQ